MSETPKSNVTSHSEAKIQQDCWIWFTNNYCLKHHANRGIMFSVPNESKISQRANTGILKGVSDTIIIFRGICLFIEFKTSKGIQSPFQKDFQFRIKENGFQYHLVRNLEEFKKIVCELK